MGKIHRLRDSDFLCPRFERAENQRSVCFHPAKKRKDDVFNALLYVSFPHQSELDWYEVAVSLFDADVFGEMIFQIGFNRSEDDANVYISLLYGRERIKEKATEDELDISKDLLTEF